MDVGARARKTAGPTRDAAQVREAREGWQERLRPSVPGSPECPGSTTPKGQSPPEALLDARCPNRSRPSRSPPSDPTVLFVSPWGSLNRSWRSSLATWLGDGLPLSSAGSQSNSQVAALTGIFCRQSWSSPRRPGGGRHAGREGVRRAGPAVPHRQQQRQGQLPGLVDCLQQRRLDTTAGGSGRSRGRRVCCTSRSEPRD
jgi:hypothetical protein